ncbi:cardiolipin synthase [Nitrosomonas sp. ANs5]|uniref:cardiolipin synthase n=1 Tax=Nitrosomonas sp. ANs5 TaxID=3423941 RepID=UPI003D32A91E
MAVLKRRLLWVTLVVAHTLGIVSSVDALMSTRTAPGAVAWIVSLNTFPYVSVPAYWVFGANRFNGYVIGRKQVNSRLYRELAQKMSLVECYATPFPPSKQNFQVMERLAKMPLLSGNNVELLIDGEAAFASIFAGIDAAEHYLLVQFYIVRDDVLGRELKHRLVARARDGVRVYFLYDEIGSYRLPSSYLDELRDAGVWVRSFHSTRGSGNRFQLNFRNHRKIVIADGRFGWVGGMNVGDEYLGQDPRIGAWRDTHLKIEGPAAFGLQLTYLEDWHWASGEILDLDWQLQTVADNGVPILILPSGPADRFETASLMVQHALATARRRAWISSPYFVPDEGVQSALKLAALRGVDVRVLIPERSDNILTYLAAYAFTQPLLEAGVKIYRYNAGFLHAKTLLIDEGASMVSTVNLDNRSFRLNFEISAWVFDETFAQRMGTVFEQDFANSREMSSTDILNQPWWFKAASRAAYLAAPVL